MKTGKIKILCVNHSSELYGSDRSFLETLALLKKRYPNIRLSAIIPQNGPILGKLKIVSDEIILENTGSVSRKYAKNHPFSTIISILKCTFKARKRISSADLIYINTIVPFGYLLAALFTSKTVIVHVREIPSRFESLIFSLWLRLIDAHLIFNSLATQNSYRINSYKKKCVIYNGIESILPEKIINNEVNCDKTKLLIIGRISSRKGHFLLLKSINKLHDYERNKLRLRIVGDVHKNQLSLLNEIETFINHNKLNDMVEVFPFDKNPLKHYIWSDVVVIPSTKPESFGRVAVEAMSASRAVIAANLGGLSEIVVHSETGWLVKPDDIDSLKYAIREAIFKNSTKMMGKQGRIRFEKLFSIGIYENNIINYLNDIIENVHPHITHKTWNQNDNDGCIR
jgi:glycosyltransferase involved in cell wall biosynthesis